MAFNAEESTDSQIKAAVALCEEEINGLPFCKEEYISLFSCYFALEIEEKDFSSKELKDALTKCASDHADCDIEENYESSACDALMNCEMAAYETHHPCGKADLAREECFHQSDDVEDAIHDHTDSYYHQYENL